MFSFVCVLVVGCHLSLPRPSLCALTKGVILTVTRFPECSDAGISLDPSIMEMFSEVAQLSNIFHVLGGYIKGTIVNII